MMLFRLLGLSVALGACGASADTHRAKPPTADAVADPDLTAEQKRKLDPRLVERLEQNGTASLPVKVRFVRIPSDAELADLLLTRVGNVVVGTVTVGQLERIAARADVEEVSYFSGAGWDTDDDT